MDRLDHRYIYVFYYLPFEQIHSINHHLNKLIDAYTLIKNSPAYKREDIIQELLQCYTPYTAKHFEPKDLKTFIIKKIFEIITPLKKFQEVFFSYFKNITSYDFEQIWPSAQTLAHSERALILYLLSNKYDNRIYDLTQERALKNTRLYQIISKLSPKKPTQPITGINIRFLQTHNFCSNCKKIFAKTISYALINGSKYFISDNDKKSTPIKVKKHIKYIDFNKIIADCVNDINKKTNSIKSIWFINRHYNQGKHKKKLKREKEQKLKNEQKLPTSKRVNSSKSKHSSNEQGIPEDDEDKKLLE